MKEKIYYAIYMLHICGLGWLVKYHKLMNGKISSEEYDNFVKDKWKTILNYVLSDNKRKFARELKFFYRCCAKQSYEKGNILRPQTFNEKLQYLKIFDDEDLRTKLSDKYAVREWVSRKIGDEYLVPLYGVWDNPEDIDFSNLPDTFVLKTNHGSGGNVIVKDKSKIDRVEIVQRINEWLTEEYGLLSFENQYWKIQKKVIAEQLLVENDRKSPLDYKFYCFNGVVKFIHLISDRDNDDHSYNSAFYDIEWKMQDFDYAHKTEKKEPKPQNLDDMIEIACRLSEGFPFVRVDLYSVLGKVYFGEMTFTPAAGLMNWTPCTANKMLGDIIQLK